MPEWVTVIRGPAPGTGSSPGAGRRALQRVALANVTLDELIERARAAGCSALVLTLDLQILGQRHKDVKNGLTAPPRLTLSNVLNMMTRPRWCAGLSWTGRTSSRRFVDFYRICI